MNTLLNPPSKGGLLNLSEKNIKDSGNMSYISIYTASLSPSREEVKWSNQKVLACQELPKQETYKLRIIGFWYFFLNFSFFSVSSYYEINIDIIVYINNFTFEISQMRLTPLSRSISRATLLYYCEKKYLFNYYTSALSQIDWWFYMECMTLKNLASLDMWFGTVIHGMMSDYLNLLQESDDKKLVKEQIDVLIKDNIKEMDEAYQKSKTKDYTKYDKNDKFWFSEHFYQEDVDEKFAEGKKNIINFFEQFLDSELHEQIKNYFTPDNRIFIESKIPDFEQMKLTIDDIPELMGITIWAQPDFGIVVKSNWKKDKYIIYDWKSGRDSEKDSEEISDQLKVYAYKTLLKIGIDKFDTVDIYCYEVFLRTNKLYGGKITWEDIYETQNKIVMDVTYQKKFIQNENITQNQALPTTCFSRTDRINKCKKCRFRKVCGDLKKFEDWEDEKRLFSV